MSFVHGVVRNVLPDPDSDVSFLCAPGGKGGVGNSGHIHDTHSGRSAGQILILKTSKKLGSILNDVQAGEAIHKELLRVRGQQDAHKRKGQLEEQTRQRFLQMKRKPWLQARAEIDN